MADHQKTPTIRDWENRDYNETIALNLRKLLDFVNTFGLHLFVLYFCQRSCVQNKHENKQMCRCGTSSAL